MDPNPFNPKKPSRVLSEEQIKIFLNDGVLTVDDVLSEEQITRAKEGLTRTIRDCGVDLDILLEDVDLTTSGDRDVQLLQQVQAFARLSTTNGSGGVLDLFYEDWKLDVATNADLFNMTTQLWKAAYCHQGETKEQLQQMGERMFRWHPYGPFDYETGYIYIDRVGYRLPTKVSERLGQVLHNPHRDNSGVGVGKKKKKSMALQRSLTPHLDCCPERQFRSDAKKWRPIQCMISLTDNLQSNMGGFEAAKGFHREFDKWAQERVLPEDLSVAGRDATHTKTSSLCVGEYTHIRPKEDRYVMDKVTHVPVKAGSAVFWDNRIPHANSYRHDGKTPRVVVYCSFLPNVPLNQAYVMQQLQDFLRQRPPTESDQWRGPQQKDDNNCDYGDMARLGTETGKNDLNHYKFSPLGRKLMGMEPW